ncbi:MULTISPECIES: DNA polymerase III subunit alpha [Thiorhodovibrio]|uniref:DNA polymerase III subunit alpha n=1 Tax=Thiorhodovibrio TaxID=61593 RepID=UPI001913D7D3|nr:DNA polymerase III subunit alpha [Thiorhodovibrio litoralis]MBK5970899.1 DNA polymerase III subunit alpha [Thiorhodovibrio winogradskyi]WPL11370.1 DNA polymerase III subunit alpha [Thiorhodovibrio litoralis]
MEQPFVHLHLHSEFSLVDGLIRPKALVAAAAGGGMPAVAVTDVTNLFCLVRFYKAAMAAGVKPIVGGEFLLEDPADPANPHRLVLLVQDLTGYRNLTRLISRAYVERQDANFPRINKDWLREGAQGLIALSAGRAGDIGKALVRGHRDEAERLLAHWLELFDGRFYLELIRTGRQDEDLYIEAAVDLAAAHLVPVVATNDVRFLAADDFDAHEVRVCIHEGVTLEDPRRSRHYSPEQYLRTPAEMAELFADLPEALENSLEIAKRCNLELELGKSYLPDSPVPEGRTVDEFIAEASREGLDWRLARTFDVNAPDFAERRRVYDERLQTELKVICDMGFPGYFLIVADFIQWTKDQGIPVGPGRGSGAGSLVAYALKITDLDPIEHDLLFERFLNPERVSMPDFDVDFCMERRDEVIDYVADKYGREAVSQIITFGTMAAKAVVRDVGRVLGQSYGFVDKIAKMVPFELKMTLDKALVESEELKAAYAEDEAVTAIIDMARKLEGLARNAGKHAGGVVIAPTKLTDFAPLYCEPGGVNLVTQFDKDDVEQAGLVKFDFLGLRTLTIIDWALKTVNTQRAEQGEAPLEIERIDPQDADAFTLLKRCATTAVFQLESRGMKELIKKLQPDSFGDITALVALFRPGPLQSGMVDDFIDRKHGRAAVAYPHPDLEPILKPTYGVILYQEQVMQIAQVLAGYSLGGADLLRRAMGKKKVEEMDKQRAIFEQGAAERGVDAGVATHIFDLMEKFAGYGFNKSHSAAYALVSYQTLWLKAHYPAAFMAAVLSADMDNTDKVVTLIDECRAMKLAVDPPCINGSDWRFTTAGDARVIYGLGAIKGVGESAIENILAVRGGRSFSDLWDFCRRIDLRRVNRRVIEALIRAGALDRIGKNRATLLNQLPVALKLAEQSHASASSGQNDLFGMGGGGDEADAGPDPQIAADEWPEWDEDERLLGEKETLGLYLTGHPIDAYESELNAMVSRRIAGLVESGQGLGFGDEGGGRGEPRTVVGLVVAVRTNKTQRGRMASFTLDDRTGRIEATAFSELYEQVRELLVPDSILVVSGQVAFDHFRDSWSLRASAVRPLAEARAELADHLLVSVDLADPERHRQGSALVNSMIDILQQFRGSGLGARIRYHRPGASGELNLGEDWRVAPSDNLIKRLRQLLGSKAVEIVYQRELRLAPTLNLVEAGRLEDEPEPYIGAEFAPELEPEPANLA